jgi:hypothetical protein
VVNGRHAEVKLEVELEVKVEKYYSLARLAPRPIPHSCLFAQALMYHVTYDRQPSFDLTTTNGKAGD